MQLRLNLRYNESYTWLDRFVKTQGGRADEGSFTDGCEPMYPRESRLSNRASRRA